MDDDFYDDYDEYTEEKKPKRQKRKRSKAVVFFRTLLLSLIVFGAGFGIVFAGFNFFSGNEGIGFPSMGKDNSEKDSEDGAKRNGGLASLFGAQEEKVYGLLVGTDAVATHTDVMIMGCFDPETEKISLISLPRDSKVTIPPERVDELQALGSPVPSDGVCKLTEVHHYAYSADKERAVYYLEDQLTDMLGVKFDFYVKVDLEAFSYLVDEIGGVSFEVPVRMYHNDPLQDLLIDLQPGLQLLDGKSAEGLVRFRGYPGGDDFMRMKVQQEFIKAFVQQALGKDNIIQNAPSMISAALKYVKTDFDMTTLPKYTKYLASFSADNIDTYTLPVAGTENIGKDYVILDGEASKILVDEVSYGKIEEVTEIASTDLTIQVLNGGGISGLAKAGQDLLVQNGFEVVSIGDYSGVKTDNNRILVSKRGMGEDLKKIVKNSDIIYDPSLDANYDIIVVIGKKGLD